MWLNSGEMVLSPNDLLTFLGCKYASIQDLSVAYGQKTKKQVTYDFFCVEDDQILEFLKRRESENWRKK